MKTFLCSPPMASRRVSVALLLVRVISGAAFMSYGRPMIQHPFQWMGPEAHVPGIFQALAALSEFGGGLAWILGLLTPLASLGLLFTMAYAVYFHLSHGDPFVSMSPGGMAYQPALLFASIALLLILGGPGQFSLDAVLCRKKTA